MTVSPGDVVHLREFDHQHGDSPLRLQITRVRLDLSTWYDGQWVWLEGTEIRPDGQVGLHRQVLVRVAVLPMLEA
ncbi:hypothetical protein ABZ738_24040 [Micromonospora sp. NPDC047793]|uniref:hypothetical protein n=1 Tax=Micromonospora sp. NPDC047793 TaxID=3154342 RepID=UPI0033EB92FE